MFVLYFFMWFRQIQQTKELFFRQLPSCVHKPYVSASNQSVLKPFDKTKIQVGVSDYMFYYLNHVATVLNFVYDV